MQFLIPLCIDSYHLHGTRRQWHPTPVLLPGESRGRGSLVGCSPWGHWESETTEWFTFTFLFHALEKEMATHSSILAWRTPGMGEPGGLPSMGLHRVVHDWSDLAAACLILCCYLLLEFLLPHPLLYWQTLVFQDFSNATPLKSFIAMTMCQYPM